MNVYDKEYKGMTLRLGFAVLLMFVLLQVLMTLLGLAQIVFYSVVNEKIANLLYWGLYNVFYFASFMLPVPFFALISAKKQTEKMFFAPNFGKDFFLMAIATVGIITAVGQVNSLLLAPFSGESSSTDILLELIAPDKGYMVVLVFIMLVIVPPFCEEFLFRGLVLGNLLPYGKGVAIVGSALLFGAMHQSYSQFLYTVAAGILLGALYVESRSIWPSTIVHMLNNMLSFAQMIIVARVQDQMLANRIVICMNLAVIFAGLLCLVILVLKRRAKADSFDQSRSLFGVTPERWQFEQPRELSPGVAVRGFFSPSIIVFIGLSLVMAMLNLLLEHLA